MNSASRQERMRREVSPRHAVISGIVKYSATTASPEGKMIIYIDMDDVVCDYSGEHKRALEKSPLMTIPQSQYGFYQKLPPLEGAIEAVMAFYNSIEYDPYILTAPSTKNPFSYTVKRVWIEERFGYFFVERLIICAHKELLKGDILIDDNNSGRRQENFEGRLIHFGSLQFPGWASVRDELGIKI